MANDKFDHVLILSIIFLFRDISLMLDFRRLCGFSMHICERGIIKGRRVTYFIDVSGSRMDSYLKHS